MKVFIGLKYAIIPSLIIWIIFIYSAQASELSFKIMQAGRIADDNAFQVGDFARRANLLSKR